MTADDLAIDVRGLTKCFAGKTVVDHIDITVPRGKIYGFLGPNGSGKTTTMRMLCGLLTPDGGEGACLDFDILTQADEIKKNIGYMTQRFSFWEDLSIAENLNFVGDIYGIEDQKNRVDAIMHDFNLTARRDQLAGTLSGGWKQRMALAACVLHDPRLLLLDEPTAGVDPKSRREFWEHIHALAERGVTTLVSTHYMDEAERCHAIVYMLNGTIVAHGGVAELIDGAGLSSWIVDGNDMPALAHKLATLPAVSRVSPFGDSLQVTGTDAARLEEALAPFIAEKKYDWRQARPSFEEVFIHYMNAGHATRETDGEGAA